MFWLPAYCVVIVMQIQPPSTTSDTAARPAPQSARADGDAGLRERIIALGRNQVDDATFRAEVRRLVGESIEPTDLMTRLRGTLTNPWVLFGLGAQALFMMRFVVQWIASERRKRSVVPVSFWWLSLAGGVSLAAYALHRHDPVFLLGQGLGCIIYVRNLLLIRRRAEWRRDAVEARGERASALNDAPMGDARPRQQVSAEVSPR